MAFYRFVARYAFGEHDNDSYAIRSLVPFSLENEKNKYFVHTCYIGELEESKSLFVSNFGYERDWPMKREEQATRRFIVHYVMRGHGFFNNQEVHAGQFFFTHPYETYSIRNDPEDPMEYYYIGVEGKNTADFMREIGFFSIPRVSDFSFGEIVENLIREALYNSHDNVDYETYFYGVFMQLMSYHKKANRTAISSLEKPDKYTYYKRAQQFITDYLLDGITPTDVARHLHVSPSYLRMIFSEFCPYSLRELLIRKKMECAINYMLFESYSVARVSLLLGYEDYSQFSKIFKKYTGMSPNAYKKAYDAHRPLPPLLEVSDPEAP